MTLPAALNDREHQKFIDVAPGETAVRVSLQGFTPELFDRCDVTYPTSIQEVYTFSYNASATGVITVNYVDSTKELISSVVKS